MTTVKIPALALALCAAAASLPACRHDVDERLGLDEKRAAQEFDPTALARPGELEKALARPSGMVAKQLGAWRLVESVKLTTATGDKKEELDDGWTLEVDGKGGQR